MTSSVSCNCLYVLVVPLTSVSLPSRNDRMWSEASSNLLTTHDNQCITRQNNYSMISTMWPPPCAWVLGTLCSHLTDGTDIQIAGLEHCFTLSYGGWHNNVHELFNRQHHFLSQMHSSAAGARQSLLHGTGCNHQPLCCYCSFLFSQLFTCNYWLGLWISVAAASLMSLLPKETSKHQDQKHTNIKSKPSSMLKHIGLLLQEICEIF